MLLTETLKQQLLTDALKGTTKIVVAYSGGVDSHVLLHALSVIQKDPQFDYQLNAIHIHHGLSKHADLWQAHCKNVCQHLSVPFQTANVQVEAKPQHSLEALAREARYQKLTELAPADSLICLAQHQDDQLETVLLQLKRGAGPKGLSGMNQQWSSQCSITNKTVHYYRPLLAVSQYCVLHYANEQKLDWCEDESNLNTNFERNFLRHNVIPSLQTRWPSIAKSVARSAQLCAQQQALLDETCAEKLNTIRSTKHSLCLTALGQLSEAWVYQVVRYWLAELGLPSPSMAVLKQLQSNVILAKQDAIPILQWQGWEFRRFDQQLFVIASQNPKLPFELEWQGEQLIQLPHHLGELVFQPVLSAREQSAQSIIIDPSLGRVIIRTGGYSAKFKPAGNHPTKPLKQWFKHWKIAPWLRDAIVLVLQNEQVLAVLIKQQWTHGEHQQGATKNGLTEVCFRA